MAYLWSIRRSCVLRFVSCFSVPVQKKPAVTKATDKVSQYQKNIICMHLPCVEEVAASLSGWPCPPLPPSWGCHLVPGACLTSQWKPCRFTACCIVLPTLCLLCVTVCFAPWCFNTPPVWFIQLMLETKKTANLTGLRWESSGQDCVVVAPPQVT